MLGAAAVLAAAFASPAVAQEVIYNPGYCAQFYPNANCQKRDRAILHRPLSAPGSTAIKTYRDQAYRDDRGLARQLQTAGTMAAALLARRCRGRRLSAAQSAPRPPSPLPRSAVRPTPARTGSSAPPAPGSAATMAGGINASKAVASNGGKAAEKAAFFVRQPGKQALNAGLCGELFMPRTVESGPFPFIWITGGCHENEAVGSVQGQCTKLR